MAAIACRELHSYRGGGAETGHSVQAETLKSIVNAGLLWARPFFHLRINEHFVPCGYGAVRLQAAATEYDFLVGALAGHFAVSGGECVAVGL